MAPKKKEQPVEEEVVVQESEDEPEEPEILTKCLRAPGQLFYGEVKAGYKQRKGQWIRHGKGQQITTAVTPLGLGPNQRPAFETLILSIYEGAWEEDMPCGEGSYRWSDGSSYEGNFEQGKMHGQGRFVWADGSSYEGSWFQGAFHGEGTFDSRWDGGRLMQGEFHYNCFQKSDGRWVDILQHIKGHELREILHGNPLRTEVEAAAAATASASRRKGSATSGSGFANVLRAAPGPHGSGNCALGSRLREALGNNLVPLVLAESSAASALGSFLESGAVDDPTMQCVSLRLCALEHKRQRDFKRFFRDALKSAILSGSFFTLVFEDDEGAAGSAEDAWLQRPLSMESLEVVPEEWALSSFFNNSSLPPVFLPLTFNARGKEGAAEKDIAVMKQMNKTNAQIEALQQIFGEIDRDRSTKVSIEELKDAVDTEKLSRENLAAFGEVGSLPPEIFLPLTFNARGKAHLLLPEADAGAENADTPLQTEEGQEEAPPEADAGAETVDPPQAEEGKEEASPKPAVSKELLQRAAAELPQMTQLGPSGHIWELTEEEADLRDKNDTKTMLGLPLQYQVLPAVVATGRVPDGLEDTEVRRWVKQRFGKHAPVHRMAIILLTGKPPGMDENRGDSDA
ncbi:PIP5K5 [Symbiodinium natans]|uniref:PIP5K5 protein n=1 Tax=Symbiodinium natans TaxID=878477 RepID=A0A812LHZ6_9DINO|nr:PIP5K5 [Symbiodinium natans]